MGIIELFLIAVGLSMDAFAVSVCKGLAMKKCTWRKSALVGAYFGIFQAGMPLAGFFLGVQFRDMVSSFRVISPDEAVPEWMRTLYETADRLYPALLSNDLSGISGLLTPDANADAYGENVWETVTIASADYALDDDGNPASAVVSVKHRLNQEEGESYNYLTMKLVRQDGSWRLLWSGIEK